MTKNIYTTSVSDLRKLGIKREFCDTCSDDFDLSHFKCIQGSCELLDNGFILFRGYCSCKPDSAPKVVKLQSSSD